MRCDQWARGPAGAVIPQEYVRSLQLAAEQQSVAETAALRPSSRSAFAAAATAAAKMVHIVPEHIALGIDDHIHGYKCVPKDDRVVKYEPYVLIFHAGETMATGHYYAYFVDSSGRWWVADDARVARLAQAPLGKPWKKLYSVFLRRVRT